MKDKFVEAWRQDCAGMAVICRVDKLEGRREYGQKDRGCTGVVKEV